MTMTRLVSLPAWMCGLRRTSEPQADPVEVSHQRKVYENGFYRRFRRLRWLLRYDCRYRLLVMEELFSRHAVPFEHQKVYELGFGTADLLLRFDTSCMIHGCEVSEEAIDQLRCSVDLSAWRQAAFAAADERGAPVFPSSDYDVVIASHVLEHVPDDANTLLRLAQHTRPGGWGLFFVPLERPRRRHLHHARTYSQAGFLRLCQRCGWQVVEVEQNMRFDSPQENLLITLERRSSALAGLVEGSKNLAFSLVPSGFLRLFEDPLKRLVFFARQLAVLARRPAADPGCR